MAALYGIAIFYRAGDILNCTPIARQLKAQDPTCRVVWFTAAAYQAMLLNNPDIDELVLLEGDALAMDVQIEGLRASRQWTRFITPAPYHNLELIPGGPVRDLIRAASGLEWTIPFVPVLHLTEAELRAARDAWQALPPGPRILVESEFLSSQSPWRRRSAFQMLEALAPLDPCFVFTARNRPPFLDAFLRLHPKAIWSQASMRLNAEFYNLCDAFIGVASGISVISLADHCRQDVPGIEYVVKEAWSAAPFGRHQERSYCFTESRFLEALERLRARLGGAGASQPAIRPLALLPDGRERVPCPACGHGPSSPAPGTLVTCRRCELVYRRDRPAATAERPAPPPGDLVALAQVLNRSPRPRLLLDQAHAALGPGGGLEVAVPNFNSLCAKALGETWTGVQDDAELIHFTPATLRALVIEAGFQVESCVTRAGAAGRELPLQVLALLHPEAAPAQREALLSQFEAAGQGEEIQLKARKLGTTPRAAPALPRAPGIRNLLWVCPEDTGGQLLAAATLPPLSEAYPQAAITVVCPESAQSLYAPCPLIADVLPYDPGAAAGDERYRQDLQALIRHTGADLALLPGCTPEPLGDLWIEASAAPRRVGHARHPFAPAGTEVVQGSAAASDLERHAALLRHLGVPFGELQPQVWIGAGDQMAVDQFMAALGLAAGTSLALFVGNGPAPAYPGLGDALRDLARERGLRVAALGPAEAAAASQVQLDAIGPGHPNLCGRLTLGQMAAFLKRCRLAVGGDGDLALMAWAVGTPQALAVGGGRFGAFLPRSGLCCAAILPLDCFHCQWHCPYTRQHCLEDLEPGVLAVAIAAALDQPSNQLRVFAQPAWTGPAGGPSLLKL